MFTNSSGQMYFNFSWETPYNQISRSSSGSSSSMSSAESGS